MFPNLPAGKELIRLFISGIAQGIKEVFTVFPSILREIWRAVNQYFS